MYRLKHYKKGWIVEIKRTRIFFTVWTPITTYAGLDTPFYYQTKKDALEGALDEIRKQIVYNYNFN